MREKPKLWCSLCKTYGEHASTECPIPLGMTAPHLTLEAPLVELVRRMGKGKGLRERVREARWRRKRK